jgi:hypothetical protein
MVMRHRLKKTGAVCRIEKRPPRLDLSAYPFLPGLEVRTTAAADYLALLGAA